MSYVRILDPTVAPASCLAGSQGPRALVQCLSFSLSWGGSACPAGGLAGKRGFAESATSLIVCAGRAFLGCGLTQISPEATDRPPGPIKSILGARVDFSEPDIWISAQIPLPQTLILEKHSQPSRSRDTHTPYLCCSLTQGWFLRPHCLESRIGPWLILPHSVQGTAHPQGLQAQPWLPALTLSLRA